MNVLDLHVSWLEIINSIFEQTTACLVCTSYIKRFSNYEIKSDLHLSDSLELQKSERNQF